MSVTALTHHYLLDIQLFSHLCLFDGDPGKLDVIIPSP